MFFLLAKGGERISSSGTFGGRGRDVAVASATSKGTTTSSIREAIRVDLDTKTSRNVTGLAKSGSFARKSSSVKANSTSVKKKKFQFYQTSKFSIPVHACVHIIAQNFHKS